MTRCMKAILSILLIFTVIFAYGSWFYHSPVQPTGASLEPPSAAHFLGTDNLGIDIFAQISRGYFSSMGIGLAAAGLSFVIGGLAGVSAGYFGGRPDLWIGFCINLFLSVPQLPIMIVIGAFFGQSMINIVLIISLFSWAPIARIIRAKTMSLRHSGYVRMAQCYGGSFRYIFKQHLAKEILPLLTINAIFVIGKAIVQEASLAFLGLSDPINKSWGLMINSAANFSGIYFTNYWTWWLLPPVVCLVMVILCIRLIARDMEQSMAKGG